MHRPRYSLRGPSQPTEEVALLHRWLVLFVATLIVRPALGAPLAQPGARPVLRSLAECLQGLVASDPHFDSTGRRDADSLDAAMRAIWFGLQYGLDDSLKAQFLGLSNDSLRREWCRRYWALRDPTPTTPENEFLAEHERRVRFARDRFALPVAPFWDERGAFYILCGQPASVRREGADVRMGVGYVSKRETWRYPNGKIVAVFEESSPGGPWRLGHSGANQTNRPDVLHQATGFDPDTPSQASLHDDDRPTLNEVAPDSHAPGLEAYAPPLGMQRARSVAESGRDRYEMPGGARGFLAYVFDADVFRGDSQRMRVEAHLQLDLKALRFQFEDSMYVARYRVEGVLLDDSVRVAARETYDDVVRARRFDTTKQSTLWPGQVDFDVAPGAYRLALRVVDLRTRDEGTYVADVRVPAHDAQELALSDLEMASHIDTLGALGGARFAKRGHVVVPNPVAVYRHGSQLAGYFEIYGLRLDSDGVSRYQVTYALLPLKKVRNEGWFPKAGYQDRPFVSSSFMGMGREIDRPEEIRIDVGSLDPEAYDLVLTVRDLVAGTEATTHSHFYVTP